MDLKKLSDTEVLAGLKAAALRERECLIDLLEHLQEFEARQLEEKLEHASTFRFCVDVLGYSEQAAYRRINVSRRGAQIPLLMDALRNGVLGLEAAALICPQLTRLNADRLINAVKGKTTVQIQFILAALAPKRDVPETARPVPMVTLEASVPPEGSGEAPRTETFKIIADPGQRLEPVSSNRIRLGLTVDKTAYEALERVRALIWHKDPSAKLEQALSEAVEFYLDKRDPDRRALREEATSRQPAPNRSLEPNRRIPQAIKDEVWHRDGGRCAYVKPDGSRCVEQKGLEYDHVVPFALGGPSNRVQNIRLLCWGHNQMEMRRRFGARA